MTDDDLLALLDAHLGEALASGGFSPFQGGWDGATSFAGTDEFCRAFPWLPQAKPDEFLRGFTTDVVLEFDQTTGLLARAYLEGKTLASTLYAVGEGALSSELKESLGKPLEASLEVLARALCAVFSEPESRITSEPFVDPA